jgi:DNA polymerase-3 subunit gamma/tau
MAVLRMLAFRPAASVPPVPRSVDAAGGAAGGGAMPGGGAGAGSQETAPVAAAAAIPARVPAQAAPREPDPEPEPAPEPEPDPAPEPKPVPVEEPVSPPPVKADGIPVPVAVDDLPPWATDEAEARDQALAADVATPDAAMVAPWHEPSPPVAASAAPERPFRSEGIVIAPPAPVASAETGARADIGELATAEDWLDLVANSGLSGPSRQLAANAAFISCRQGTLKLGLSPGFEYLRSERALAALGEMLEKALGHALKIVVETVETEHVPAETLHQRADRQRGERQQVAEAVFMDDPEVQVLIQQHGARVVSDSIRSFDE